MIITKKKINAILTDLERDSADESKARGETGEERIRDFYWRCGNANAVNFIRYKLGIERSRRQ